MGKIYDYLKDIPLYTLSVIIFCSVVLIITEFISPNLLGVLSEQPASIVQNYEIYRIITGQFLHGGFMHLGMNMFTMYSFGYYLEKSFGTIRFFFINLAICIVGGVLFTLYYYIITGNHSYIYTQAVGYSGVLFGLMVIECTFTTAEYRSVFGCFDVPTRLYPFVMAVLISIVLSGISFVGHACGILAGFMCLQNWLCFLIPSIKQCEYIQESRCFHPIYKLYNYCPVPNNNTLVDGNKSFKELMSDIWYYIKYVLVFIKNVLGCLLTCGKKSNNGGGSSSGSKTSPPTYSNSLRNGGYARVSTTDDSSTSDSERWNQSQGIFSGVGHKLNEEL